ncbi:MBL fold metallo-hydrolase [Roseicyclus marinus]|uniref:MBL fold metallo-hydrolase n=1 Tax=Roseicyclus marinus TaxID=2161673 RepID=UPI00240EF229|nr:MBL fold metallo-hydrolase [Roseicyclus marinus]MDG3040491.1 MBL fold metallo-hydrolase [Roseicyclus marinus]
MESESGVIVLEPGVRRLTAPNPSPMTYRGTNTYLLGEAEVAVIDPGPDHPGHMQAILAAVPPGARIGAILVTHSHRDHSPLARPLSQITGAPVLAAGPSDWGRSAVMAELAANGRIGGGEGVDLDFAPDERLAEGDSLAGGWGEIGVLETPGHMANHLSFSWNGALFTGDHVMGWSTSLVSPPDGDMGAFMASCRRLAGREDRVYYPGHGDPVATPRERIAELIAHREGREAQILAALSETGAATASGLAARLYTDLAPALLPAAERNVLAHLLDLAHRNQITALDDPGPGAHFAPR